MTQVLVGEAGPEVVMAMTAAGSAESPTTVTVHPSGRWEGVLAVMDQWSADRRMLRAPEGPVRTRPLPLPLLVQPELAPGHDRARLGIAQIERIWSDGGRVMGSGIIDMEDPLGPELARKIAAGYIRFVSLDVDDSTELQVCLDAEDNIIQDCDPGSGEAVRYGQVYSGWRVMSATLLAHPAFPDAYIAMAEDRTDDEAGPRAQAQGDAAAEYGCVRRITSDGVTQWSPADCSEPGAVPANPNRTGPDPTRMATLAADTPAQGTSAAGCVVRDEASQTGWRAAPCDADGAVPANAQGTGPAQEPGAERSAVPLPTSEDVPAPTAGDAPASDADAAEPAPAAESEEPGEEIGEGVDDPAETEESPDLGGGCVVPDEASQTGWRAAPCDADGAVPANAQGTGPAEEVTEATSAGEEAPGAMAVGRWAVDTDLPWADRERPWDGAAARRRVAEWATEGERLDPARMSRAFLVVDGPGDEIGSYKFGVADIVDGRLELVWRGVVAAYAALQGARTPTTVPAEARRAALARVKVLYNRAAERFDDESIAEAAQEMAGLGAAPFQQEGEEAPVDDQAAVAEEAPAEPDPQSSYLTGTAQDLGYGCVTQDEDGRWSSARCTEEGARTAGPDGQPVGADGSFGCVAPDEAGRWVSAPCTQEGARIAGPDGQPLPREEEQRAREQAGTTASCAPCGEAQVDEALVASAGEAPGFNPPAEWFADPQLAEPTPVTVDVETGRIRGHLAVWGTCHVGYSERCITPPKSSSSYAYFHTARISTPDGPVDVGLLTMDTGHAGLNLNASNAAAHYDNTGTQCAVVRVGEDAHGIWMAGACLPFINADQRLRLSLARFSGDWRAVRGSAELVAALAVNSPGFPIPQRRRGQDNRDYALVAAGLLPAARPAADADAGESRPLTAVEVEAAVQRAVREAFEHQAVERRRAALAEEQRAARLAAERDAYTERWEAASGRVVALRELEYERRMALATGTLNKLRVQALSQRIEQALFRTGTETSALPPVLGLPKPARSDLEFARGFRNWVSEQGGLPRKIKSVAQHLRRRGMGESQAIAVAVNVAKKACRSGDTNWPGVQRINARSRQEFCAAVTQWERMKARARAS